jgi:hypothetical protein
MGLIRSYSRTHGDLDWSGDPGFGKWFKRATRVPKGIRKFQPGKTLASLAPAALGFIPGVGGLLSMISQRFRVPLNVAQVIAERAGYSSGDPWQNRAWMGDPGPAKKRKTAASGTKAKAAKKAAKKAEPKVSKPSKAKKAGKAIDWGALGEAATSLLPVGADLAKEVGRQFGPGVTGADIGLPSMKGFRVGGHRRSMNPANVKALRRGLRRVESFERLVKSVERILELPQPQTQIVIAVALIQHHLFRVMGPTLGVGATAE